MKDINKKSTNLCREQQFLILEVGGGGIIFSSPFSGTFTTALIIQETLNANFIMDDRKERMYKQAVMRYYCR